MGRPELIGIKLPYGAGRYAAASLATFGFTGQRKDSTPNLTYMHARFYDQEVGVFLSPDAVRDGPNPYAYVGGMVESAKDPSGQMVSELDEEVRYAAPAEGGGGIDLGPIIQGIAAGIGAAAWWVTIGLPEAMTSRTAPAPVFDNTAGPNNLAGPSLDTVNTGSYAAALSAAGDAPLDAGLARHWGLHTTWSPAPTGQHKRSGGPGPKPALVQPQLFPAEAADEEAADQAPVEAEPQPDAGGAMQPGGGVGIPPINWRRYGRNADSSLIGKAGILQALPFLQEQLGMTLRREVSFHTPAGNVRVDLAQVAGDTLYAVEVKTGVVSNSGLTPSQEVSYPYFINEDVASLIPFGPGAEAIGLNPGVSLADQGIAHVQLIYWVQRLWSS